MRSHQRLVLGQGPGHAQRQECNHDHPRQEQSHPGQRCHQEASAPPTQDELSPGPQSLAPQPHQGASPQPSQAHTRHQKTSKRRAASLGRPQRQGQQGSQQGEGPGRPRIGVVQRDQEGSQEKPAQKTADPGVTHPSLGEEEAGGSQGHSEQKIARQHVRLIEGTEKGHIGLGAEDEDEPCGREHHGDGPQHEQRAQVQQRETTVFPGQIRRQHETQEHPQEVGPTGHGVTHVRGGQGGGQRQQQEGHRTQHPEPKLPIQPSGTKKPERGRQEEDPPEQARRGRQLSSRVPLGQDGQDHSPPAPRGGRGGQRGGRLPLAHLGHGRDGREEQDQEKPGESQAIQSARKDPGPCQSPDILKAQADLRRAQPGRSGSSRWCSAGFPGWPRPCPRRPAGGGRLPAGPRRALPRIPGPSS